MANTKTTGLAELAETPDNNDIYPIVDVSDTTMAVSGTNKYIKASRIVHQDTSGNIATAGTATFLGSLGVGVATASTKLHVVANSLTVRLATTAPTQSNYIGFYQTTTARAKVGFDDVNNTAYLSSMYGDIVLKAAGTADVSSETDYLIIKAGGFIGVGTASPTAKLDVAGTVQCDALRIDQTPTSGTFTNTHYITVNLNGTNYRIPCAV